MIQDAGPRAASESAELLDVLMAFRNGDFSVRMRHDHTGLAGKIADALNDILEMESDILAELGEVARAVGNEGIINRRINLPRRGGGWTLRIDHVNGLVGNLVQPLSEVARVIGSVARGDLTQKVSDEVDGRPLQGEFLRTSREVNGMVAQLSRFASEVTRVAREVGTEGKLGGQADVARVEGTWKDLTDDVNSMASNLTSQVRNIAEVTIAVANGDLSKKITVDVRGEILALKEAVNTMVDQLRAFASKVTRVAREVGTEGKLGGQALVPGAGGVWRDLTDNVNQLAGNLTSQVRAIADVATAVTAGNLSSSITIQAAGEVAVLKDNINEMIRNLRETTIRSTEQDWLKTNLAKFTRMLQGQRDLLTVANQVLSELAPLVSAQHGVFYLAGGEGERRALQLLASYAFNERKSPRNHILLGEGLVGQAALEKVRILITEVPADYVTIESGLGRSAPLNLVVLPVVFEGCVNAVVELASFNRFSPVHLAFLEQLTESIGIVLNTISATMRKEELLMESQALAKELQGQQEEMTETNKRLEAQAGSLRQSQIMLEDQQQELRRAYQELEERAGRVTAQKKEVEAARAALEKKAGAQQVDLEAADRKLEERARLVAEQKAEVEAARAALQEKAEQLTLASKYKSEFLANMSHDLRTPLNSLLILSRALEENPDRNLTARQVEYAATIHGAGQDLLELINDVLDLSKIESGTMGVDLTEVSFRALLHFAERTFRPVAEGKGLRFEVHLDPTLPPTFRTDSRRLQQVLRNLLSNAFKFTEKGEVTLRVAAAAEGWTPGNPELDRAPRVLAFSVRDTGIGIDPAKHRVIFEAFQQADGTTSRKYGGTGLGLSISRGIAAMFGGEITLASSPGEGSQFTLYLPADGFRGAAPVVLLEGTDPLAQALDREVLQEAYRHMPALGLGSPRRLLLVEDDRTQAHTVKRIMDDPAVETRTAATGQEALEALRLGSYDCMVLDLNLPDMTGLELLRRVRGEWGSLGLPVIIHTARELTMAEELELRRMVETIIIKDPRSPERVFDETAAFLGRPEAAGPHQGELAAPSRPLEGRRVLLVDDDSRNILALRVVLEPQGSLLLAAASAWEALDCLDREPVDLVLMDIMLPGMDGFEAIRALRAHPAHRRLPVIALTAKAMPGDREKCLAAGANGYLPKPVDPGQLLAAIQAQLAGA